MDLTDEQGQLSSHSFLFHHGVLNVSEPLEFVELLYVQKAWIPWSALWKT